MSIRVCPSHIPPPPPPTRKKYCCAYCGTKWTEEQCKNCGSSKKKEIVSKYSRPVFPPNKVVTEGAISKVERFFSLDLPMILVCIWICLVILSLVLK